MFNSDNPMMGCACASLGSNTLEGWQKDRTQNVVGLTKQHSCSFSDAISGRPFGHESAKKKFEL